MNSVKVEKFGPFTRVNRPVFIASALLIVGFIIFGSLFGELAGEVFNQLQSFITHRFRWLFIILMNVTVVFSLYIALSRYGDIRLGHQTEHPEYSLLSWFGMLFSAGIGIGLLYWGTAEPLYHFMSPPMGQAETVEAAKQAMSISFLHWGVHAWALYCVVALSLAYFHYRRGLPLSIRSVLYPLIGQKIYGKWGHVVDTLAVFGTMFGTMFGVVTSLGLGAMQINAGFSNVFGIPNNVPVQLCLIAIITAMATLSVMTGLDKGIKRLSDINIVLTVLLLGFMLFFGPTQFIIDSFIENIGNYVSQLIPLRFWSEAYSNTDWQANWTIFYWA